MAGFLTFVLVAIAVFWLLGQVGRVVLRWWILKKQREFSGQSGSYGRGYGQAGQTGQAGRRGKAEREGEVRVQQTRRREKKVSSNVGDYVDYEEVKAEDTEKK